MKQFQVRRLPVIDASGKVGEAISLNDVVLACQRTKGPAAKDVLATFAAVCAPHRTPEPGLG